jgi:hypothetical protein
VSKLIGSSNSIEHLNALVCKYFYSQVSFIAQPDGTWLIQNSKGFIEGFRVVNKTGRYRFELIETKETENE